MSKEKVQSQNFHEKNQPKLKNYFWKRESSSQLGERKGPKGLRDIKTLKIRSPSVNLGGGEGKIIG